MKEAVNTSETSVSFYETTRYNIPEDAHLHIRYTSIHNLIALCIIPHVVSYRPLERQGGRKGETQK